MCIKNVFNISRLIVLRSKLTFDNFLYLIRVPNVANEADWILISVLVTNVCNSSQQGPTNSSYTVKLLLNAFEKILYTIVK